MTEVDTTAKTETMTEMEELMKMIRDNMYTFVPEEGKMAMENSIIFLMLMS